MREIDWSTRVEIVPAAADEEPIVANLLELYCHDFSEFIELDLRADGRFGYPHLRLYWSETERYPFLVRVDGKLAGLVFVKRGATILNGAGTSSDESIPDDATVWDMAEFFVVRQYRRSGLGTEIAHQVWRQFPGRWEVRVRQSNAKADRFWQHATEKFSGPSVCSVLMERGGEAWRVFSFESVVTDGG